MKDPSPTRKNDNSEHNDQRMRKVKKPADKKNASTRSQRRSASGGAKDS